jgi:CRISPR-associated protein Csm2
MNQRKDFSEELDRIIVQGDAEALVNAAVRIGQDLARRGLKTHQVRNFFGAVRSIEMNWLRGQDEAKARRAQRDLRLLQPKLAYQSRRMTQVKPFAEIVSPAIDKVLSQRDEEKRKESFTHFVEFLEAVVAYHGGD